MKFAKMDPLKLAGSRKLGPAADFIAITQEKFNWRPVTPIWPNAVQCEKAQHRFNSDVQPPPGLLQST